MGQFLFKISSAYPGGRFGLSWLTDAEPP